jgi:DME family drug/metabolite transporter
MSFAIRGHRWLPIAAVLAAAFCWGTQGIAYALILGMHLLARHRMATVLAMYLLLGTLGLVAAKLLVSPLAWPAPGEALTIGLYTGVVTTLAPVILFTFGLSRLPSSEATILLTFEPVVAIVLAGVVLGESLAAGQWLGAIAVLSGVVLLAWPARRARYGPR